MIFNFVSRNLNLEDSFKESFLRVMKEKRDPREVVRENPCLILSQSDGASSTSIELRLKMKNFLQLQAKNKWKKITIHYKMRQKGFKCELKEFKKLC